MAYSEYDSRYAYRPSHESSFWTSRDQDVYSRPDMRTAYDEPGSYRPTPYYSYDPRYATQPSRSSAHPGYRSDTRTNRWPPSPSAEDETASLAREVSSAAGQVVDEDSREARARGSVDQYPIIEEIEQPANDERRFVLVSDPSEEDGPRDAARDRRRKSVAERGNMAHLKTDLDDMPLLPERMSTPYAFTKPQKESLAPSAGEYFLSPEAIAPSSSGGPRPVPNCDARDASDQNARPAKQIPVRTKPTSSSRPPSPSTHREKVFEDSDDDADADTLRLSRERKPARYSFVKSDLHKGHLRTNVLEGQAKSERESGDSFSPSSVRRGAYPAGGSGSTASSESKQRAPFDTSRSSSSSLNGETRKSKPAPVDPAYTKSSKYASSRPSSPRYHDDPSPRSPRLPPRRPASPTTSRPPSRSARPPSPPSSSYKAQHSPQVPITEADWHSTYPPTTDRARPATRPERYDTMPVPMPQINVKSPSPDRPRKKEAPLPYPVDDRLVDAFMPPEDQYQHDPSYSSYTPITTSPRPNHLDSPVLGSPRESQSGFRPQVNSGQNTSDSIPRSPRMRSSSVGSQTSNDGGRKERKTNVSPSLDRPLPSCPRVEPSSKYNDWYTLRKCSTFDICPSCYDGVFADTAFAVYFSQTRRYEQPVERICDFSSPWMRLAWLLTIKQRRQSPDLLYTLATIADQERPCPGDRELSTDDTVWYGIADPRDGIHIANFALCPCDVKMIEALFPSMKGVFTRLPTSFSSPYALPQTYTCSLRVKSRRFPKYLDLLVELDAEAQSFNQYPNIHRFVQLAREYAFKAECQRDKQLFRKAWHFIPALPELTVCQECFDELIWPHLSPTTSSSTFPSTLPKLFNRTIQPVPGEDPEIGSSCCLYSPRMRKVWEKAVRDEDFGYLERKALERKKAEGRLTRERRELLRWMDGCVRGSREWERAKEVVKTNEGKWKMWE